MNLIAFNHYYEINNAVFKVVIKAGNRAAAVSEAAAFHRKAGRTSSKFGAWEVVVYKADDPAQYLAYGK